MNRFILAGLLMLALANCQTANEEKGRRIVLPNSKLLRCQSADCFQLWSESPLAEDAVFPKQLTIDMNQGCLYGMTAVYDKSISLDDIKAAINSRYGKWELAQFVNSPVKLWRIESEKFAIQLSVADKKDEKMNIADAGTKKAIYLAFGGRAAACNVPGT